MPQCLSAREIAISKRDCQKHLAMCFSLPCMRKACPHTSPRHPDAPHGAAEGPSQKQSPGATVPSARPPARTMLMQPALLHRHCRIHCRRVFYFRRQLHAMPMISGKISHLPFRRQTNYYMARNDSATNERPAQAI